MSGTGATRTGIVIIGRNEGERFRKCLASLAGHQPAMVYVDSGSTDGSPEHAASQGVAVVNLDMSRPFTAARARNEGMQRLLSINPGLHYVQFVDGDCTVDPGWLESGRQFLDGRPDVAAICGRLNEMHPEASIYNWICHIEWNQADGESEAVGGNAMFRVEPFNATGGFNETLIAGEEPELCLRLRESGWRIWRLARPMGRHDAAITRFSQWWKRSVRGGYGMTRVALMHWRSPKVIWKREVLRTGFYVAIAVVSLAGALLLHPAFLLGLGFYLAQIARMAIRRGPGDRRSWQYAGLLTLSKFAEAKGIASLAWDMARGKDRTIYEYKQ